MRILRCFLVLAGIAVLGGCQHQDPALMFSAETPSESAARHEKVVTRRAGNVIICHRGASEFAHENTLEAYRATFELGADGNEIDIRKTSDGVLVCFHDDLMDHLLPAYGDLSEFTWEELQCLPFREQGLFGEQARIPTLVEVFNLHRQYGGLLHLDIKRPGLDVEISELLTKMDMWDQVAACNNETGGVILKDPRYKPLAYKGSLYEKRAEVEPVAIEAMLKKPGQMMICDDPRGAIVALGRKLGKPSVRPVRSLTPKQIGNRSDLRFEGMSESAAQSFLRSASDALQIATEPEYHNDCGEIPTPITTRALTAEWCAQWTTFSNETIALLEDRVRNRSLHKHWLYHGADGAAALRTLILLKTPHAVELSRFVLWRDDPILDSINNPEFKVPRSWVDWRMKNIVFPALEHLPGPETEKLCRDYLALTDEQARVIGPPQFEPAARTLLTISPKKETAIELMKHANPDVRGRAILICLLRIQEPWAMEALREGAPYAIAFAVTTSKP